MTTLPPSLGSFAFVPWLRRGVGLHLGAAAAAQTPVLVGLQVGGHTLNSPPLALHGPGDIVGFDPAAICRIWPSAAATNAEPDYLALIEFDQADVPWRFSPSTPSGDQLSPWLCLVVATDAELSSLVPGTRDRPLGTVTITGDAALPDLTQSHAWAHAEAIGETGLDGPGAASLMRSNPQLIRSRVLCPRQLAPNTAYTAFLVPTLELGRLGGLLTPGSNIAPSTPAWTAAPVTLPVYYSWTFSTGAPGDFSILIRELTANPLPDAVALRDMDVSGVSGGSAPIGIGGALTTAAHPTKDLPAKDQTTVTARYAAALSPSPPAARPPMYGNAYIGTSPPAWYSGLNNDPRTRAAAGLGGQVIREHADALLAGAWSQAAGLREANQQLRQWELSRELARSVWTRHAPTSSPDTFVAFVSPIASRLGTSTSTTLTATVQGSTIPDGALSPALRRLTRPLGRLAMRQQRTTAAALLSKLSNGAWLGSAAVQIQSAASTPTTSITTTHASTSAVTTVTAEHPVNSAQFASARLSATAGLFGTADPVTTLKAVQDKTGFADAAATLFQQLSAAPAASVVLQALDLAALHKTVAAHADPAAAIDAEVESRTIRADGRSGAAPFVVAPSFDQPMSQWLSGVGQQWLLPGLAEVPANTVSLLAADRRFLEAFMVGLNHEMGQRLIFDEYPVELGAMFFQNFWGQGTDDIAAINNWGTLGSNPAPGRFSGDPLVLLIRGDIVRRYPNMQVLAVQATSAGAQRTLGTSETAILFSGRMDPDVAFYGFPLTSAQALGTATTPGYYFVIQEHPSEPRFGGIFGAGSSAAVAAALLQHPVRLAIYAADLLVAPASAGSS